MAIKDKFDFNGRLLFLTFICIATAGILRLLMSGRLATAIAFTLVPIAFYKLFSDTMSFKRWATVSAIPGVIIYVLALLLPG